MKKNCALALLAPTACTKPSDSGHSLCRFLHQRRFEVLPRYVARLMPPDLRAVPIVRPVLEFPIVAIRLAKQPLSPAAMAFLAMARQHLKPSLV